MNKSVLKIVLLLSFCRLLPAGAETLAREKTKGLLPEIPDMSIFGPEEIYAGGCGHLLFKESRNDTLLNRISAADAAAGGRHMIGDETLLWSYRFRQPEFYRNDPDPMLEISPLTSSHLLSLAYEKKAGSWLIRPGLAFTFSGLSDTLLVERFPVSDNRPANDYFFDLLPQTFGDTLPYNTGFRQIRTELYMSKELGDVSIFGQLSCDAARRDIHESHINTGSSTKLQGPRESELTLKYRQYYMMAGVLKEKTRYGGAITFNAMPLDWHQTVYPVSNDIALDITDLADGNLLHTGIRGFVSRKTSAEHLEMSALTGYFSGHGELSTPVLGYILFALPVSHSITAELSAMYGGAEMRAYREWTFGDFRAKPEITVTGLYAGGGFQADALLQFGLDDIHIDEMIRAYGLLGDLRCDLSYIVTKKISLTFSARQFIPYLKIISPEIEWKTVDKSYFGGLSAALKINYEF